ncbi:JAB1/Mov34/MPN/PAD-1 ubiquitin protease-domain-containing protein [Umbelopsis sp. PMI_123]|nr:JAB1/Mov34/MPN/PAD-1 ubiquitin protease-domain-containing protein [Umbelopsis sp. PMI_123]
MSVLSKVTIAANVFHVIASHAASTEKEEIIGVLLGSWQPRNISNPFSRDQSVAVVEAVCVLTRSDKRRDRVEISPVQLHLAVVEAEKIEKELGRQICVVGWYHSHPHITVFPSHIDIRTQLSQQMMDPRFFGLIVSCFDTDVDLTQRLQITCFQSKDDPARGPLRCNIPLEILPDELMQTHTCETIIDICHKVYEEQEKEFSQSVQRVQYDYKLGTEAEENMLIDESDSTANSLPRKLNELYNAGIYGQEIISLIDKLVVPATELANQRHLMNLREVKFTESITANLLIQNTNVATKIKRLEAQYPALRKTEHEV